MKQLILLVLSLLSLRVLGQFYDDFSDGDLLQNPIWQGDVNDFVVNENYQLQLNREGNSGTSILAVPFNVPSVCEWSFYIRLAFNPSSNNNARVYLAANDRDILQATQALYLQFGESGSADAIELFWQEGGSTQSICRATNGAIAQAFACHIKLRRYPNAKWQLLWRPIGETNYQFLAGGQADIALPTSAYFGLQCHYTVSNAKRFYFDDIAVQPFTPDNQSPVVNYALATDAYQLRLFFSEAMDVSTLQMASHYQVDNVGFPHTVTQAHYQQQAVLSFPQPWQEGGSYYLHISGLKDLSGNLMPDTNLYFSYAELQACDLQINELMPDPYPPQNLPAEEYVELYNHSLLPLWLYGYQLKVDDRTYSLPSFVLESGAYLLLCHKEAVSLLSPYGNTLGISGFNLPNAGASVVLLDSLGQLIHGLDYNLDWYQDTEKADGGWSLEQLNPNNMCGGRLNWHASADMNGGTPGMQNAHWETQAVKPSLINMKVNDNTSLALEFNQNMKLSDLQNINTFSIDQGIGKPFQVVVSDTAYTVLLLFADPMQPEIPYRLHIDGLLRNCVGDPMSCPYDTTFLLNKTAEPGDVLIHEIMLDPTPAQALPPYEYIELYNRTTSPLVLEDWQLWINDKEIGIDAVSIPPKSYLLLCSHAAQNDFLSYGNTLALRGFSLPNTQASLALSNADGQLIHQVHYHASWHEESKADGGWSLEMKDNAAYCVGQNNWGSSHAALGGTPALSNSIEFTLHDYNALRISGLQVLDSLRLRLHFNRSVDSNALGKPSNYSITPDIGEPAEIQIHFPAYQVADISLSKALQLGKYYSLNVEGSISDCLGNDVQGAIVPVALPQTIEQGDVLINELLFDAKNKAGEYIELVNASGKVLNLEDLHFTYINTNSIDSSSYTCHVQGGLLFPQEYVVFSAEPEQVKKMFFSEHPERILAIDDFPSLSVQEGSLVLHLRQSVDSVIDQMYYHKSMHYPLLQSTKGVALERIDFSSPGTYWHSAASTVGYGTPAYQNSQYLPHMSEQKSGVFQLDKNIFSPNNDGVEDLLCISYQMPEAGYRLSAQIFDAQGILQKHLYEAELLGVAGELFWDGTTDQFAQANMGIYIIYFEYFNLKGEVHHKKFTVVVANRW